MKLLCLGGGFMQVNAIRKAKAKGYTVIVSDYLPDAPGKAWADHGELVSTFDAAGNIEIARRYEVDGVFTIGTDQPVLTAAAVAEALDLPHPITAWTALRATNKKFMKEVFQAGDIPCSNGVFLNRQDISDGDRLAAKLDGLRFPVVVKPLDSQGQRGIFKLYRLEQGVVAYLQNTFEYTRCDEILVEEFFAGDELTISAWVVEGNPYILMITDRPLINIEPHLGTPDGHIFPSIYSESHRDRIQEVLERITRAFRINSGPLYVQMMIRQNEMIVVEIACRIGGGHEEELIPLVTGCDVVDWLIEICAGKKVATPRLDKQAAKHAMVRFVVARPGRVQQIGDLHAVLAMPGVVNAGYYRPAMQQVSELTDSTRRVGYMLVEGSSREDVEQKAELAYQHLQILDDQGGNLIVNTHQPGSYYQVYSKGEGL